MNYLNKKIIIIDNSDLSYTGDDINGTILRGTEASLILLSEQFVRMGINVDYCNTINTKKNRELHRDYKKLALKLKNFDFGGRLADYAYYDMDMTISAALKKYEQIKKKIK